MDKIIFFSLLLDKPVHEIVKGTAIFTLVLTILGVLLCVIVCRKSK